jgi:hypothetical protein
VIKKRQMVIEAGDEGLTAAEQFYSLAASLNLSEFVDGCSWSMHRGIRLYEALLFARDWLENDEEWHSVSARIYELQTAINRATGV